jgi:hypothetical protein
LHDGDRTALRLLDAKPLPRPMALPAEHHGHERGQRVAAVLRVEREHEPQRPRQREHPLPHGCLRQHPVHEVEILSAFVDGEDVDPTALADALARPGALEALQDFVALRVHVRADVARPRASFYDGRRDPTRLPGASWWDRAVSVRLPVLAAAGILAVFLAGAPWVLRLQPRGDSVSSGQLAPPPPDRVLHFERGVDWQEVGS